MQPIIEIKTIQYMLTIEREGCFQKAADAMYISQPALSQYIRRIEDSLNIQLYERTKHRCVPTKAGSVLLEYGKPLLENYNTMLEKMNAAATVKEVRIGWPTGYTVLYFSKLVSYMEQTHQVHIHVVEDSVEKITAGLLQRDLDLIFVPAIYSHSRIEYTTVRHEEFYLAVPKNHKAAAVCAKNQKNGFIDLRHLKGMPFLVIDAKAYTDLFYALFKNFEWNPTVTFFCKDWERGFKLVEDGSCLAILPYWYANYQTENTVFYKIKSSQKNYRLFACGTYKDSTVTSEMQSTIDYMTEIAGDEHAGILLDQSQLPFRFHF